MHPTTISKKTNDRTTSWLIFLSLRLYDKAVMSRLSKEKAIEAASKSSAKKLALPQSTRSFNDTETRLAVSAKNISLSNSWLWGNQQK